MDKLQTVDRYAWYIRNALMYKVESLKRAIAEAEQTLKTDTERTVMHRALEGLIDHCQQSLKEHSEALKALEEVGVR